MTAAHLAMRVTEPWPETQRWYPYRWTRLLNRELYSLAQSRNEGREAFLLVEAPVRHGKSELGSIYFPAWWRMAFPDDPIIQTGHNDDFAKGFSIRVRELVQMAGHMFPERPALSPYSTAAAHWQLRRPHIGRYVTAGVGNPPTGRGGKLIVIDDPIRGDDQAYSEVWRNNLWRWWQNSIRNRLEPGGAIVIIMSRWHEDDLIGRLLALQEKGSAYHDEIGASDRWRVLHLPALAVPTDERPDPLGRVQGEALCPERYTRPQLLRIRDAATGVGELAFEALYQGNPTLPEGSMFQVGNWRYVDVLPHEALAEAGATWVRRWDMAGSEAKSGTDPDWTAGVLMCRTRDGRVFVVDARRDRRDPLDIQQLLRNTKEEDRARWKCATVRIAIDPGQAGIQAHGELSRMVFPEVDFGGERESGEKAIRARPWAAQQKAGNVFLVAGAWNKDFVEEHRTFPLGHHDDWVDASSLGYLDLIEGAEHPDTTGEFRPQSRRR